MGHCMLGDKCALHGREHESGHCSLRHNIPPPQTPAGELDAACEAAFNRSGLNLDVSPETARAVHRVVRGFHDGECPRCHRLFEPFKVLKPRGDCICPKCGFTISAEAKQAGIRLFAPHMDKALAVFEAWQRGDARPAEAVPSAPPPHPPPQCRLTAHDTGDGWALMAEDGDGEVMGYLEWPKSWPESVNAQFLRDRGFTVV